MVNSNSGVTEMLKKKRLTGGIEIAYTDSGGSELPVIVFIHGLANYHAVWQKNIDGLHQHYRCIAVDLPGNGSSSRQHRAYSIDFYAESIAALIREMQWTNVTLAGHSMGGLIAMKMVLHDVFAYRKLLLFAPAGFEYYSPQDSVLFKSAIAFGNFLQLDEVQISQSVRNSFYRPSDDCEQIISDLCRIVQQHNRADYRHMLEQSVHSMLDEDIFSKLKQISLPTLVFFGENDMLIPNRFLHPVSTKEIAETGTAKLPQAKLICFPATGHFVQIERAAEVNQAIMQFMKL